MTSDVSAWGHRGHRDGNRYVLALQGELDMSAADELRDLFTAAIGQAPVIEVDLDVVTFIDSTVISTLINAHHEAAAAGGSLHVSRPTGHVHRVLTMTGVLPTLTA